MRHYKQFGQLLARMYIRTRRSTLENPSTMYSREDKIEHLKHEVAESYLRHGCLEGDFIEAIWIGTQVGDWMYCEDTFEDFYDMASDAEDIMTHEEIMLLAEQTYEDFRHEDEEFYTELFINNIKDNI